MVKIITDTTACLSPEFARRYHIPVIPQIINFGNDSYQEGSQIDNATFMERLSQARELPKTAAPPPEFFVQEYKRLQPSGETILCIHPSADLSGTVRSASVSARDIPGVDIRVIDTRVIGSPLGTMVECASRWSEEGLEVDTIISRLKDMTRCCRIYFLVATLDYLARGGRIGGAAALLGSVLQIKPILHLRDGRVDQYVRERTYRRALARLQEIFYDQAPHDGSGFASVMHAGVPDQGYALAESLKPVAGQTEIPVVDVPPAIVTHGGPGILAAAFFIKE